MTKEAENPMLSHSDMHPIEELNTRNNNNALSFILGIQKLNAEKGSIYLTLRIAQ